MVILALDTTTPVGSVALTSEDRQFDSHIGDPTRTHSERLPGDIETLLKANGLTLADVELYGVCSGPGSFTGLRVGLATIQALALVYQRPVVAVSSLDALAWATVWSDQPDKSGIDTIGSLINAHRGEVFGALYRVIKKRQPSAQVELAIDLLVGPAVGDPEFVLKSWLSHCETRSVRVVGDAVQLIEPLLKETLGPASSFTTDVPSLAPTIARVAAERAQVGDVMRPDGIRPVYVRRSNAELARDRQAAFDDSAW